MLGRKLALSAILSVGLLSPVLAADLGGNAYGDLEERIAELEATAARKGNRKVTVVISGQVDKAYLWTNNIGTRQSGVVDNANSPSFISVAGSAKLNGNWKAGFIIEMEFDSRPALNLSVSGEASPTIRTAVAYVDIPVVGTLTVGHGNMASQGTGQMTVANTAVASKLLSLAPLSTTFLFGYDLPFSNVRRDGVRWDSGIMSGFVISASLANGDNGPINVGFAVDKAYDVALRWAGGNENWRAAAGVSYRDEQQALTPIALAPLTRSKVSQGSASLMNMQTGLFANLAFGDVTGDVLWGDFRAYQAQAGIEKNFFGPGNTTIFAEFGEMKISGGPSPKIYGLGFVQRVDGLAVDLYLDYKRFDTDPLGGPKVDTVLGGIRVQF